MKICSRPASSPTLPRPADWARCRRACRARCAVATSISVCFCRPIPEVISKASDITVVAHLPGRAGIAPCCIGETRTADGLILYLVLEPSLYQRTGSPYAGPEGHDWPDNDVRFARLSLAAAEIAAGRAGMSWQPDVLHVNDWPCGLAPAYLRWQGGRVPTILTIHNIAYQGLCDRDRCRHSASPSALPHQWCRVPRPRVVPEGWPVLCRPRVHRQSNLCARDHHRCLWRRPARPDAGIAAEGRLSGIVNGIDETWDPGRDPHLPHHFEADRPVQPTSLRSLSPNSRSRRKTVRYGLYVSRLTFVAFHLRSPPFAYT